MPDRISLVRWRDAKTNPPEDDRVVLTDHGTSIYTFRDWYVFDRKLDTPAWVCHAAPPPSVWCDPSPPGDDAPTSDDLRDIATTAWRQAGAHFDTRLAGQVTRLRRAIEEAER